MVPLMRSDEEFTAVQGLVASGFNDCQVSRLTGIPRGTVRYMRIRGRNGCSTGIRSRGGCPVCGDGYLDDAAYAYLLGLYLGDGCLSEHPRKVFRLRITLDETYGGIIKECEVAVKTVRSSGGDAVVGKLQAEGCLVVYNYWKHWPCLFPQHGPGRKHDRTIRLMSWQEKVVDAQPQLLLRGLIHSDGSRDLNWVNGKSYPRYQFTNHSADIRNIFTDACDRLGVHWTHPYWKTIAISRRADVEKLDRIIGPKR